MLPEVKAVVFIPLTRGKVAVINFEDFEKVRGMKWHALKIKASWYAARRMRVNKKRGAYVLLHRFILDAPKGSEVDHKDGDGLNDTRNNIRICSPTQNRQAFRKKLPNTSSKFRGVTWMKKNSAWAAQLNSKGKHIHLGLFQDENLAARAYDRKAREIFGEFAALNFPI